MSRIKTNLLFSAASLAVVTTAAQAADLPAKAAAPIEYVRVCGAYGAGFFYIPGTDTCLRVSGRARFEVGYSPTFSRGNGTGGNANQGDTTGYRGLARFNLDARTQTGYGTLRAFARIEIASRTGATQGIRSGTQERIGQAFGATGQDQNGRAQQFVNLDKAFIQFAGLTAGRASSFFDFYAHDFEIQAATAGSDVVSTNLIAYTAKLSEGFTATVSLEDPTFRRNGIYSQESAAQATFGTPYRVFAGLNGTGLPLYGEVDLAERNRLPDFVGVLRYDAAWGSAQISSAVHELNTGNYNFQQPNVNTPGAVTNANGQQVGTVNIPGTVATPITGTAGQSPGNIAPVTRRPSTEYGYAVQGGVKVNLPFVAPGDAFYLQGAYGMGATLYTGFSSQSGSYITNVVTLNGSAFNQFIADATLNPFTGKIQAAESFSVVGSFLHYWSPEWRSAFFASYGENNFARGAREANFLAYNSGTAVSSNATFIGGGPIGSRSFALSPVLRDNYQIIAGASLIWSPVKDLDIGVEGVYIKNGLKSGRVVNQTDNPVTAAAINAGAFVRTVSSEDTYNARFRVQRDF